MQGILRDSGWQRSHPSPRSSDVIAVLSRENLARIILEQPVLGAKILMELVLLQRLRQTGVGPMGMMDKEGD